MYKLLQSRRPCKYYISLDDTYIFILIPETNFYCTIDLRTPSSRTHPPGLGAGRRRFAQAFNRRRRRPFHPPISPRCDAWIGPASVPNQSEGGISLSDNDPRHRFPRFSSFPGFSLWILIGNAKQAGLTLSSS